MERWWHPGEPVVIREVWAGRIFEARPCTVVQDLPSQTTLFRPSGAACAVPIARDGSELRMPMDTWDLALRPATSSILSFAWPETPYAVLLPWREDGTLGQWYVNLQAPLVRTDVGFDTVDHVLDVVIEPDRSAWRWKDEDELAEAAAIGHFTAEDAAWFRWWGERAVEHVLLRQPPFDLDWESWTPDPSWPLPGLPFGWDLVPPS